MRVFVTILFLALSTLIKSQVVGPPSLRCIECSATGDLKLTWIAPADPTGKFFSYEIFRSNIFGSGYVPIATINTYTVTTYNDVGANGNSASKYYYIKTHSGPTGTVVSNSSDTLRSLYLNLTNPANGTALLNYNNLHQPKLSTSGTQFKIYRENPTPTWVNIKNTSALSYKDTISVCSVFYNYQIQLSDASGCMSTSNVSGAVFQDKIAPFVPVLDSVSVNAAGQSILGWNASSSVDCFAYVIYQYTGTWQAIDTLYGINNTIYSYTSTAANGSSIQYCVAAIDSCGNISPLGTPQKTIYLKSTYSMCARKTDLKWNAYRNIPLGVSHYQVYCSTNAGPYMFLGSTIDTTYQHNNLVTGKNYSYFVRVFNTFGGITATSNRSNLFATAPPSSSYVYLKSASVNTDNKSITVSLYCDTTVACKGFNIYKLDDDGYVYNSVGFVTYTGFSNLSFTDSDVKPETKSYYYKAEVIDSCGNSRYVSNIGKTVLLKVKNNNDKIFENNLSWDNYSVWLGGVAGYNVYRVVNDTVTSVPVDFVPSGINTYTDNVEDIVSASGKIGYIVVAAEGFGNPYGIMATSNSNKAEAYVEGKVFVPGAFAPKGVNRIWKPVTQFVEKTDYHVIVFDRWGQKVFETTDENEGWDGSGYEDNTYVYLLQYKNSRGEFIEMKGTVTMVR